MPRGTPSDLLNFQNLNNYFSSSFIVVISLINRHVIYYFIIVTGMMVQGKETAKKVLVILFTGAEQMEVGIPVDVMRRAKIEVPLVALPSTNPLTCSRDVVIKPDCSHSSVADTTCAAVLLPGGASCSGGVTRTAVRGMDHYRSGSVEWICLGFWTRPQTVRPIQEKIRIFKNFWLLSKLIKKTGKSS